ncbi:MAG: GEVED domain-containing protein [Taibaiella sp.]|jgi:hypothetical protein
MKKSYTLKLSLLSLFYLLCANLSYGQTYCSPADDDCTDGDLIQSFSTTGGTTNITNNNTGCGNTTTGYSSYITMIHTGAQGSTVNYSITNGEDYDARLGMWVDWNNDGDFNDAAEVIFQSVAYAEPSDIVTGSFTIPAATAPGNKRMRVRLWYIDAFNDIFGVPDPAPGPCDVNLYGYGETEDYTITVTGTAATCATPTIPTATSITGTTASLNWTQTGTPAQWQIKYGAAGFNPATAGTAIITSVKPYTLNPPLTPLTSYDYYVRAVCGPADTSAWSVVKNFSTLCNAPALLSTKDSNRCGTGEITLQATAATGATINWYANATGGAPLGTGNSFTTPSISNTTTYHVAASSGSTGSGVVRITEMGIGDPDGLEIQNVGSLPIDVTGWKVAVSNSYTSITSVNANIQTLSGTMAANDIKSWTDLSSNANYWGSNILWNPGVASTYTGWALILDNNNNLVDFVAFNWPVATIQATTLTIGSASVSLATAWTGAPLDANPVALGSGSNFQRIGSSDQNQATDFNVATATLGTTNTGLTLPFGGSACESPRIPVVATIKTTPTVSLPNDTTICPGVSYTFNAGNTGAAYAWNTGAATQSITANAAGTYSVSVTSTNGCTNSDTINITPGIVPVNNLPAITNLCAGEMATLNAGNTGSSFTWTPGSATTQAINVNTAGNYSVVVKSSTGCQITSTTNLIIRPLPVPSLGNDTSICDGAQIILNAGNPGHTFNWNTGATTQTINASDSGTYSVVTTSPYNCVLEEDKHIAYLPSPRVEGFNFIPLFYEELGKVRFSPLNPTNVNSYEWNFGDGTPTSVQVYPEHNYASGGNYVVTLKVFNGCGDFEISLPINVDLTTGIIKLNSEAADVVLYPNPSKDYIIIENKSDNLKMQEIAVFNTLGAMVYNHHTDNGKNHKLNVNGLASGLYSIRILTDKGFVIRKVEVIK